MLDKLTQLLRASMARHRVNQVSVKSEVDLIDAYLSIQKVRLGSRLDFEFIIADAVKQQLIPPYLLQPLVENAIKHGIEPSIDGGTVTIRARSDAQQCILEVIDNGLGLSLDNTASTGHGIGIQNAKSRLSALYQDRATLNISENQTGGVTATIKLPLEHPTP
ncbi:autolysin sensor kinase [Vibrio maritimus]|uniref:Autolysin sensor kinase n=1 Tax=Vibrio maritimus TaxID=990268 RepID=A0A090S6A3_9VIBR|nr:autolysin sensor kinase [Vibrio maritimus]